MKKEMELELNRHLDLWDLRLCSSTYVSESVKLGVRLRVVRLLLYSPSSETIYKRQVKKWPREIGRFLSRGFLSRQAAKEGLLVV